MIVTRTATRRLVGRGPIIANQMGISLSIGPVVLIVVSRHDQRLRGHDELDIELEIRPYLVPLFWGEYW